MCVSVSEYVCMRVPVCVMGGRGLLHLLPLSCCQAGDQPTEPGLKPSRSQARTTRERGRKTREEGEKDRRGEEARSDGEEE